jgi:hypothetical protein
LGAGWGLVGGWLGAGWGLAEGGSGPRVVRRPRAPPTCAAVCALSHASSERAHVRSSRPGAQRREAAALVRGRRGCGRCAAACAARCVLLSPRTAPAGPPPRPSLPLPTTPQPRTRQHHGAVARHCRLPHVHAAPARLQPGVSAAGPDLAPAGPPTSAHSAPAAHPFPPPANYPARRARRHSAASRRRRVLGPGCAAWRRRRRRPAV